MKFTEIPRRLQPLLAPPDPIVIHHLIKYVFLYRGDSQLLVLMWPNHFLQCRRPRGKEDGLL